MQILSKVHWKRIILDEGHQLGGSLTQTNKLLTAIALKADCRWVMTGVLVLMERVRSINGGSNRVMHTHG